jgi:NAD(P)-dependent dehydrogenase (short-subunit alcohol dehydrogenase family)
MSTMYRFTSKLAGQKVLVIGGTSGIGLAVTKASIEFGAAVVVSSSTQARVQQTVEAIRKDYSQAKDRVVGYTCDLGSPDVESNLENLFQQVGKVDHIVFTAGDPLPLASLDTITLASIRKAGQIRAFAALLAAKVGSKYLTKNDRSNSIVLTTGTIAEKPHAGGFTISALFGAGLLGLTRQLAFDLQPVRVNIVSPGLVDTNLWSGMSKDHREAMWENVRSTMPTRAVAASEDVAEAYLYLMRDMNVTGSCISTNSGALLV